VVWVASGPRPYVYIGEPWVVENAWAKVDWLVIGPNESVEF
jgi:hypothetical protein